MRSTDPLGRPESPDPAESPPDVLRLTGNPVRWHLLAALARSDRLVRELTALVGQRQSLTSYHLGQLRDGGLVTVRRSSADRRYSYYSLNLTGCRDRMAEAGAALHPGLRLVPAAATSPSGRGAPRPDRPPTRVLFLCTGNSARSQMAQAILQLLGGARVVAASAGSHPKTLHPDAVRVMRERGIDLCGHRPKHLGEYADQRFDHVISLCDRVREVCPDWPGTPAVAHWSLPDPVAEAARDDAGRTAFRRTADDLTTRIRFLLDEIDHDQQSAIHQ
jgi:ArsR family transcriptional regulator, arsenate/arsenite/antimonite-responsive transcriptional repressor / arsenate reductase (thioredoxin)